VWGVWGVWGDINPRFIPQIKFDRPIGNFFCIFIT
jgi:hypothetical protein